MVTPVIDSKTPKLIRSLPLINSKVSYQIINHSAPSSICRESISSPPLDALSTYWTLYVLCLPTAETLRMVFMLLTGEYLATSGGRIEHMMEFMRMSFPFSLNIPTCYTFTRQWGGDLSQCNQMPRSEWLCCYSMTGHDLKEYEKGNDYFGFGWSRIELRVCWWLDIQNAQYE